MIADGSAPAVLPAQFHAVLRPTADCSSGDQPMFDSIISAYRRMLAICRNLDFLGPLAVRIVVGASFVLSGKGKLGNLEKITDYFTSLNIPKPHANAVFVSLVEFVGGVLLI